MRYQYISERKANYSIRISSPADVLPLLRRYKKLQQEAFIVITLNGAHEVIAVRMVSIGIVNRALVHPREVFCGAITDRSTAIIAAHNHPSGNCTPSEQDKELTQRLKEAGGLLGIPLLDNVIFTKGSKYYSFLESGTL